MVVYGGIVGKVRSARVFSGGGVVVMGDSWGYHVTSSSDGEAGVPPPTRGYVILVRGFLKDSV
jgi:hypothetical protein